MKTGILLLAILVSGVTANSQSIKDLLYSGKLKSDTGSTVRKGDDLSTKIDTTTKRPPAEPEKAKVVVTQQGTSSSTSNGAVAVDSMPVSASVAANTPAAVSAAATKDNNKVWKDYMDELIGTLRTEVLPNKKIKDGTYSVLIEYEISPEGQIGVTNVSSSPESSFLEDQVKERLTLTAPQLTPLVGTNGKPRKAVKKQTITLAK